MNTQQSIADHLDLSQPTVSELMGRLRIDWRTTALDDIRIAYIRHLRERAAGRAAAGELDLAGERARLAKEQADRVAMQNAVTRNELAPAILIEQVLGKAAAKVAGLFDAIPGLVHRRVPSLPIEAVNLITGEIVKVRNVVANLSLADLDNDEKARAIAVQDAADPLPDSEPGALC